MPPSGFRPARINAPGTIESGIIEVLSRRAMGVRTNSSEVKVVSVVMFRPSDLQILNFHFYSGSRAGCPNTLGQVARGVARAFQE